MKVRGKRVLWPSVAIAVLLLCLTSGCSRRDDETVRELHDIALAQLLSGQVGTALTTAQSAVEIGPKSPYAWWALGAVRMAMSELDAAETAYRTALELAPGSGRAHTHMAQVLYHKGYLEDAWEYASSATELGDASEPRRYLALIASDRGDEEEAVRQWREVVRLEPTDSISHHNMAVALASLERLPEAIEHFRIAQELEPDDWRFFDRYVGALWKGDRVDEAITLCSQAVAEDPDNGHMASRFLNLMLDLGRVAEAMDFLEDYTTKTAPGLKSYFLAQRIRVHIYRGETDLARERLTEQIQSAGDDADLRARNVWSWCWLCLGQHDRAVADAQCVIAQRPEQYDALATAGIVFALSRRFSEAVEVSQRAGLLTEDGRRHALVLAYSHAALGAHEDARLLLRNLDDYLSWEYRGLEETYLGGLTYHELGETENAHAFFERAIDRWPKHPWSEKMREMMQ